MVWRPEHQPTPYASNPIIALGSGGTWYEKQLFDPQVFVNPSDSAQLLMYLTGMAAPVASGEMSIGRATAAVSNPRAWTITGQVLTKAAGQWDDNHVRLGCAFYDGSTYYMYYTGGTPGSGTSIGLATSSNGTSWTRHASNPVLTPNGQGRDDGDHVSEPAVIKEGSAWTMIYSYRDGGTILPGYRYATSSDGVSWTKGGSGDVLTTAPLYGEFHQIRKIGSIYWLFCEIGGSSSNGTPYRLFAATSGVVTGPYALMPSGPILRESSVVSAWDRYHVATPCVVNISGVEWLYYCAAGDLAQPYYENTWPMGCATWPADQPAIAASRKGGR